MKKLLFSMFLLFASIIIHYFIKNDQHINLEIEKCPFCYGNKLCSKFLNNQINFNNLTLSERLLNLINVKNVYSGYFNDKRVVIKKLGHNWELEYIDKIICKSQNLSENCLPFIENFVTDLTPKIIEFLTIESTTIQDLKLCSRSTIDQFMITIFAFNSHLNISFMTANVWTTFLASAEPLLLQILNEEDGWPIPKYYGACGRAIVEEYCGRTLNVITTEPWINRARIALQLLKAADDFTNKHKLFRFYLTDISSDNIVVSENNNIKFIDLENIIIMDKNAKFDDTSPHESENLACENCYAFSSVDICNHSISDHNFYAICKLLLSKNAPWPMMTNGLLHSPTEEIQKKYSDVFNYVEICTESSININRFEAAKRLAKLLETVIENEKSHL